MNVLPLSFEKLINELSKLPSIGKKSAQRLAFFLLKVPLEDAEALSNAIIECRNKIKFCEKCFGLTESEFCDICLDHNRDNSYICVVEKPEDIIAIENAGVFKGSYHVLHGSLSPLDRIGPDQLKIKELEKRAENSELKEIIIATNPTVSGEATADYINSQLSNKVLITRLAYGISTGSGIEYADPFTLQKSLTGRQKL
jgi:recombination protein RecR